MAMRRTRKPAIKEPWHVHGGGDKEIRKTEKRMVQAYQDQLAKLNDLLLNVFMQNSSTGLLTYADIAANGQLQNLMNQLRVSVDEAFVLRQKVIQSGLRGAANDAYTDILYQAEKIAYARAASRNKANILPMEARLEPAEFQGVGDMFDNWFGGSGMNGIRPTQEALDALNEQSKVQLQSRIKAALAGAGTDLKTWRAFLSDELSKDAGRFLSVLHMDANRIINEARGTALESNYLEAIKAAIGIDETGLVRGLGQCMIWKHDEPRSPRAWHVSDLHNTVPDYDGYWWSNHTGLWLSARGPSQFGCDEEDRGCKCYLDVGFPDEARGMSTNHGVVPVPKDYVERRQLK